LFVGGHADLDGIMLHGRKLGAHLGVNPQTDEQRIDC
jgi:hypothetical protein